MTRELVHDEPKVLIVDDDAFMRRTIRVVLRAVGHFAVEEADDGDTALEVVAAFKPHVVLCDVHMPRMDGLHFVERLRDHADVALRQTPVVMLTLDAEQSIILEAARLKVSGYLVKPVSPQQLGMRLQSILHQPH